MSSTRRINCSFAKLFAGGGLGFVGLMTGVSAFGGALLRNNEEYRDEQLCSQLNVITKPIAEQCESNSTIWCNDASKLNYFINLVNATCPNGSELIDQLDKWLTTCQDEVDKVAISGSAILAFAAVVAFIYYISQKLRHAENSAVATVELPEEKSSAVAGTQSWYSKFYCCPKKGESTPLLPGSGSNNDVNLYSVVSDRFKLDR